MRPESPQGEELRKPGSRARPGHGEHSGAQHSSPDRVWPPLLIDLFESFVVVP
jgi:hypothetical protein